MADGVLERLLARQRWMDRFAEGIQGVITGVYRLLGPPGRLLKDLLHGTKLLHHPLHPALTDAPMGAWLTGVILDYLAITSRMVPRTAGTVALAVGVAAALGSVASGYTDFRDTFGMERRTALAHGLVMTAVFVLECVSLAFRLGGWGFLYPSAVGLSTAGFFLAALGMYAGGHVVYRFGTMVNHTAWQEGPRRFELVGASEEFPEGKLCRVEAAGMPVLLVRLGSELHAIGNTCTHAGGPLDEGTLDGDVVTCPWHGSRFCVTDGRVRRGPASFAQPRFEVREQEGKVEVRVANGTG